MSNLSIAPHRFIRPSCGLALGLLAFNSACAQSSPSNPAPVDPQQSAYRDSIAQEELKKQTDSVQHDIQKLIKALEENGLDAPGIERLNIVSANLASLSNADMQKVIVILQKASINPDQQSRQQGLVDAFNSQTNLSAQFKDLSERLSAQQEADQISTEIEALIIRQKANLRQTSGLGNVGLDGLTKDQSAMHQVISSEQGAIGNEIASLSRSLSSVSSGTAKSDGAQMAQALIDYMNHSLVVDAAQAATTLTQNGPFPNAAAKQKSVLDYLVEMLTTAHAKQSASDQISRAKAQLDQVIADQKTLSDATANKKQDPATLAQRQNELNDRAEVAMDLIKPSQPQAAQPIKDAQSKMDAAAAQLKDSSNPAAALASQKDAVKSLEQASKDMDTELASIQAKQNESPAEKQDDLQKLQNALDQAKQTAQTDPKTAAQQLQQAQQDAAPQSQDAAQDIADAAKKLSDDTPDSDQAQKDIDAAKAELQKEQDALAQDAQDFKALTDAKNALDQAKQNTEAADKDLKGDPSKSLTDAARQLSDAQNQASQAAQTSSPAESADAKAAAQQAAADLKNSLNQAVQTDRNGAHASAQAALQQIESAQAAIGQSLASLQQKSSQKMMALGKQGQGQQGQGQQGKGQPGQGQQSLGQMSPPSSQPSPGNSQAMAGGGAAAAPGSALVVGTLSKKDREALTQFQSQKTPPEYAAQIQQYLQNLANYGNKN